MKLRVRFSKHGALRFIGHLDVMRYFQKAIRRAEIDVKYTTGFSPHQVMSFASPLGVGLESDGEYMDIEVNSMEDTDDIRDRLNAVSVPEIRILSVKILPEKAGNAMASVRAADYEIRFKTDRLPSFMREADAATINSFVEKYLDQESIIIQKEGKAGLRDVDIKVGILEFRYVDDHFYLKTDASSAGNVKAKSVMETFVRAFNEELAENAIRILRLDTYTYDPSDENILISMDSVGYEGRPNIES